MYNLLIVDDESLILDGLGIMINKKRSEYFYVFMASSVADALEIFKSNQIDLLLTDIRMPGMSGLQLMEIVEKEWPDCLTIFLTGHSEFDYARQAVSSNTIGYVLKLEGDDSILEAVDKGYARLEQIYAGKSRLIRLNDCWKEAIPLLRQECFQQLISIDNWNENEKFRIANLFHSADIGLDIEKPFLLSSVLMEPEWNAVICRQIQNAVEETVKGAFQAISAFVSSHMLFILAQSSDNRPVRLKGFMAIALNLCEHAGLKLPQIFIYDEEVSLKDIPAAFTVLEYRRFEIENIQSVRLCGKSDRISRFTWREGLPFLGNINREMISESLIHGNVKDYFALLDQFKIQEKDITPPVAVTVFMTFSSLLLQAVLNYLPNESRIFECISLEKVANYSMHRNFPEAMHYLEYVAEEFFKARKAVHTDTKSYIVHQVNSFIYENIAEDLSVTRIGEYVGLHPTYLSRIYKEVTNTSLNQYIISRRLNIAKCLLENPKIKIQTVIEKTGFKTASYFTHFFKKYTGFTPQEYRNRVLNTEAH